MRKYNFISYYTSINYFIPLFLNNYFENIHTIHFFEQENAYWTDSWLRKTPLVQNEVIVD